MNYSGKSIALLIMLAALAANAYLTASNRLDLKNVSAQENFLFSVQAKRTWQNTVKIRVTVKPKKRNGGIAGEADMFLSDGKSEITRRGLPNLWGTNLPALYEYEVASYLATNSQFVFRETWQNEGEKMQGDSYWFFLKDFLLDVPTNN